MKINAPEPPLAGSTKHGRVALENDARQRMACALLLMAALVVACRFNIGGQKSTVLGVPPQAQAVIDTVLKDMSEGRYNKIYDEAADEWKQAATIEKTKEFFTFVREKLGGVRTRDLQTVRDQENSGGELPGHSLVVIYETTFERDKGMETVTLVERNGRWLLASYYVTSSALKQ
jgi:hypothetical protein